MIDVPERLRPTFPPQWSDLVARHSPPDSYTLLFRVEGSERSIGYCRLSPDFPGCFPFVLAVPGGNLAAALVALGPYLLPQHRILRLTLAGAEIAQACDDLGFSLNYRLFKMAVELHD